MSDRPSRNEEEYFALREAELHRERHRKAIGSHEDEERKAHFMKCPHCGAEMNTVSVDGITTDRCTECHGVFIEAEAADRLLQEKRETLHSIFKSMIRGVSSH
ncbi:MAG: zf-TFIIB domain-containing protein [Gemmatimonadota bacterium]|nr:MAG: zf-TFIIB domain-containing protein [Gemmatimonadota bacterium]